MNDDYEGRRRMAWENTLAIFWIAVSVFFVILLAGCDYSEEQWREIFEAVDVITGNEDETE